MSEASAKRDPATNHDRPRGQIVSVEWFPKPAPRGREGPLGTLVRIAVGAAAGGVLWKLGHTTLAIVAWAITGVVGAVSLASPRGREALAAALGKLGLLVGNAVGSTLLTLVYLFALTPARLVKQLTGSDDLRLRDEKIPSYYEPCDAEDRKVRYARTMFATEVVRPRRGNLLVAIVTAVVLLGLAEVILRVQGFGAGAVLYVSDPLAGYYPAPNQKLERYGGRVHLNNFGMRAPDFSARKPEGAFRILMLGDSTLWGGSYVDQDQLYARLLEGKLNGAANGGKVEVLNMGVNGWGPFHERGYVDGFGTFEADLVIVCLPHDDLDRDRYTLMSLPYFSEGRPPRLALEEVVMHTIWRYRRDRVGLTREWRARQRELGLREYESLALFLKSGDPAPAGGTMAGGAEARGAEVFFELLPSRAVGLNVAPADAGNAQIEREVVPRLTKTLEGHGITVHYPSGLFVGKGKPEDLYHDETHLHWQGHAVYADFLLDRITTTSGRFAKWAAEQRGKKAR